jgi:hypothetical protein
MASSIAAKLRWRIPADHPTAVAFLDETGAIAQDRFFAVGCLILPNPAEVFRKVQALRDKEHWYTEIKWADATQGTAPLYTELMKIVAESDGRFSCFVADRKTADPVRRFKSDAWLAYRKLGTQLLIGSSRPGEMLSVLADNYSTPSHVKFEEDLIEEVNHRLRELAVVSVCRLDSRSCDGLQLVDVLTGAVAFEFRQKAKLAGQSGAKANLAAELRSLYGATSWLSGFRNKKVNVAVYRNPASGPASSQAPKP